MRMFDAKTAMQKKLDDVVPMKETKSYQTRLDDFVGSWKL